MHESAWSSKYRNLAGLALITAAYAISFFLPVLPPNRDTLNLNPNASATSGLGVVIWCARLLTIRGQAIGVLAVGGLIASNLGLVAAWAVVTGLGSRRVTLCAAAVSAGIGVTPGIFSAWKGRGYELGIGYYLWVASLMAAGLLAAWSVYGSVKWPDRR